MSARGRVRTGNFRPAVRLADIDRVITSWLDPPTFRTFPAQWLAPESGRSFMRRILAPSGPLAACLLSARMLAEADFGARDLSPRRFENGVMLSDEARTTVLVGPMLTAL